MTIFLHGTCFYFKTYGSPEREVTTLSFMLEATSKVHIPYLLFVVLVKTIFDTFKLSKYKKKI